MMEEFSAVTLARPGKLLAHHVTLLPCTGSTNDDAARRASQGAAEGEVILAEVQECGRGRHGRSWSSPAGRNLLFSVILRPGLRPERAFLLTLAAGVAAAEAIKEVVEVPCQLKWPNDLLLGGRKVGGILCEMEVRQDLADPVILGMGINVNARLEELAPEIRDTATTIYALAGREISRVALFRGIMARLESWYTRVLDGDVDAVREAWLANTMMKGKTITVHTGKEVISGIMSGIDREGALLLDTENGKRRILAGDVTRVR